MNPIKTLIPALLLALGGCAGYDTRVADRSTYYLGADGTVVRGGSTTGSTQQLAHSSSYWDGDGIPGRSRIHISLSDQKAYFYKGDQLVGVSAISTGREGYGTPSGQFKITQKNRDHRSNLYGDYVDNFGNVVVRDVAVRTDPRPAGTRFAGAPMPYFMRVHGGVGMHAGYLPGFPASHGCIRMPEYMAQSFFNNVKLGTPVLITQ